MPSLDPDTLVDGRYRIIGRIGSGGMADVYEAEDTQLGRRMTLRVERSGPGPTGLWTSRTTVCGSSATAPRLVLLPGCPGGSPAGRANAVEGAAATATVAQAMAIERVMRRWDEHEDLHVRPALQCGARFGIRRGFGCGSGVIGKLRLLPRR